jgi:hypothetical protein
MIEHDTHERKSLPQSQRIRFLHVLSEVFSFCVSF